MRRRCCSGVFAERDKDLEQSDERAGELCGRPPSCDNAGSFRVRLGSQGGRQLGVRGSNR